VLEYQVAVTAILDFAKCGRVRHAGSRRVIQAIGSDYKTFLNELLKDPRIDQVQNGCAKATAYETEDAAIDQCYAARRIAKRRNPTNTIRGAVNPRGGWRESRHRTTFSTSVRHFRLCAGSGWGWIDFRL
jgi:hypothetical protein